MNPGLVVKLRPAGPWRIGPDSGARNRVDFIYHSDSLYSAVTSAMARLGSLDEWLNATARQSQPAACFSSCFPFLDEIGFVVPPRTIWPPTAPAFLAARVRWKSARFVPLGIVQAILAGQQLDENHWTVDGASECLVPAGRPGPFRTGVRWNGAIDRMTGAVERHSTACIEFRPGSGLWTVVSFRDDAAQATWSDRVKAAFRLLADTGFGGERSRGWGRTEAPEFIDGMLPEMILPSPAPVVVEEVPAEVVAEPEPEAPVETAAVEPAAEIALEEEAVAAEVPATEPEPELEPVPVAVTVAAPEAPGFWLLSLFAPAAEDTVDWARGNYSVLARGGRVDSPAGSGELKKQVQMIAEGSVIVSSGAPRGAAPDVAPEGFAHPVFRAGFALSIPLPGGEGSAS